MSYEESKIQHRGDLSESKRKLLEKRMKGKVGSLRKRSNELTKRPAHAPPLASLGQQRIWLLHHMDSASPNYNITSSFYLDGEQLNVDGLEKSINRVIGRHEILRSNYLLKEGNLLQVIREDLRIKIEILEPGPGETVDAKMETYIQRPFQLDKEPLIRVILCSRTSGPTLLTLVIHDIICDKWSLGIFWKEVGTCYCAFQNKEDIELPELPVQYGDFAHWQREWLSSSKLESHLAYWTRQLANPPEPIPLPTDRPYPKSLTDHGSLERWKLSEEVTYKLRALAAEEDTSLFTILLYGFSLLLNYYSGAEDIVVGAPVANRRHKESAKLIGFYLSTVGIRTRFSQNETLLEGIRNMRQTCLESIEHQDVPLDRITEHIKPTRVEGRHPLFQTLFVYQREDEAAPPLDLGKTSVRHTFIETKRSKFDLTLFVAESGPAMETILEYRTDLFDPDTMHRMLCHFEILLNEMVNKPDKRISEIELMPEVEVASQNFATHGQNISVEAELPLHTQVSAIANSNGTCIALTERTGMITYEVLHTRVERLARHLISQGVQPDQLVGVFIHNSTEAIVALLAILRCGAGYVPIDPNYPAERCRFMMEDTDIQWVVSTNFLSSKLPKANHAKLITEDGISDNSDNQITLPNLKPESIAYVIYTSGSTGKPKGVQISHRNLQFSTAARKQYYPTNPEKFLLIPSLSFDSSIAGIFWTLSTGGDLVIPDQTSMRDPDLLTQLIDEQKIKTLLCVPTLYQQLLNQYPQRLRSLNMVIVAGENCSSSLVTRHFENLEDCQLYNEYGPTECTVWSTVHACTKKDGLQKRVPIGNAIPGVNALVLDSELGRLPSGIPGELYIGGPGVAPGYLNRKELTQQRFPITNKHGRLYKTGDRAQWDSNGNLHFLGRFDDQVKIRGYRIELGEIEQTLQRIPGIEEVAVVAKPVSKKGLPIDTNGLTVEDFENILTHIENLSESEVEEHLSQTCKATIQGNETPERVKESDTFRLQLFSKSKDFIQAPRRTQRDWLISQAMNEFSEDLDHLDKVVKDFVPGFDHDLSAESAQFGHGNLTDPQIMEDWQAPLMKRMANYVAETHGDILEIGFGRGISAEYIQQNRVKNHTIIESNKHCIQNHFKPWQNRHASKQINLIHSRWQDIEQDLGLFDGIFFHAFPLSEDEFVEYILKSVTFAEHAFETMATHLREGGIFTYLTTEIDSLSRRHQRRLFQFFSSITTEVIPISVPADTKDTWWAPSMVMIKAVK